MEGFGFFNVVMMVGLLFQVMEGSAASGGGFSLNLVHRDSPRSPFFDPGKTQSERMKEAFLRSVSRLNRFQSSQNGIVSSIVPSAGEFLMNISIGTPPVAITAIADTGSDLTWTQCQPCDPCYSQIAPLFNTRNSSTYSDTSCGTSFCLALRHGGTCNTKQNLCTFSYSYSDGSYVKGNLAAETLTVLSTAGEAVTFPGFAFGCGHSSGGVYDENSSGIVSLGMGELSMVYQMDSIINGLFAYCLQPISTDPSISSRIDFGTSGIVDGPGAVSTPLIKKSTDLFYYVTLKGFSVGQNRMMMYKGLWGKAEVEEGNIIVDSGTTYTFIPMGMYLELQKSLLKSINGRQVSDPYGTFSLCYQYTTDLNLPVITAHFEGADVDLQPLNTFLKIDDNVVCLTFLPTDQVGVFGNLAQVNFQVGYDIRKGTISFKPADCTRF